MVKPKVALYKGISKKGGEAKVQRTYADEERILGEIEAKLTPAYQIGPCEAGHDIDHVKRMIKITEIIADQNEIDLLFLKIAIWCHNLDRTTYLGFQSDEDIAEFIQKTLFDLSFAKDEIALVIDAVLKHNQMNQGDDSPLLSCLKDCDRLDMGVIGVLRIAASGRKDMPIYASGDFGREAGYIPGQPHTSIIDAIDFCLQWEGMLRNPQAKKFGERRFAFLRQIREEVEKELQELGLI